MRVGFWMAVLANAAGFVLAHNAVAVVRYVDDSAPTGGDGMSWATAFNNLHAGLVLSRSGDELLIGQGVYRPAPPGGDKSITFTVPTGVMVRGGFAGFGAADPNANDPGQFVTNLSGDLNNNDGAPFNNWIDNSMHVVSIAGPGLTSTLRGLLITGGNAVYESTPAHIPHGGGIYCRNGAQVLIEACELRGNRCLSGGGAIYANDGRFTVRGCLFIDNGTNSAGFGGAAIWIRDGLIEETQFFHNITGWPVAASPGGGVHASGEVTIQRCEFKECAASHGAAVYAAPTADVRMIDCTMDQQYAAEGGVVFNQGTILMRNCTMINNLGGNEAGGFYNRGTAELVNCRLAANRGYFGGAVRNESVGADLRLTNSIISGNRAFGMGGAVSNSAGQVTLVNCTVTGNLAMHAAFPTLAQGGGLHNGSSGTGGTVIVHNSILWENNTNGAVNEASQILNLSGSMTVEHSCVMFWSGGLGGAGNFGFEPLLMDMKGPDQTHGTVDDNTRLTVASPCRDAGDLVLLPPDAADLDDDTLIRESLPLDFYRGVRVRWAQVDIGAHEFGGDFPADIAPPGGDGVVNVQDLLAVIASWGACPGPCPPSCVGDIAPVGGDCAVNVQDLLAVIANWG